VAKELIIMKTIRERFIERLNERGEKPNINQPLTMRDLLLFGDVLDERLGRWNVEPPEAHDGTNEIGAMAAAKPTIFEAANIEVKARGLKVWDGKDAFVLATQTQTILLRAATLIENLAEAVDDPIFASQSKEEARRIREYAKQPTGAPPATVDVIIEEDTQAVEKALGLLRNRVIEVAGSDHYMVTTRVLGLIGEYRDAAFSEAKRTTNLRRQALDDINKLLDAAGVPRDGQLTANRVRLLIEQRDALTHKPLAPQPTSKPCEFGTDLRERVKFAMFKACSVRLGLPEDFTLLGAMAAKAWEDAADAAIVVLSREPVELPTVQALCEAIHDSTYGDGVWRSQWARYEQQADPSEVPEHVSESEDAANEVLALLRAELAPAIAARDAMLRELTKERDGYARTIADAFDALVKHGIKAQIADGIRALAARIAELESNITRAQHGFDEGLVERLTNIVYNGRETN
jgi:hypothetical protein